MSGYALVAPRPALTLPSFAASCRDRHDHDASAAGHVCTAHDETALWSCSCAGHPGQFLKVHSTLHLLLNIKPSGC